jgi:hypothetical protein
MNEQAVRNVVLVRAIESADSKRQVLSDDDLAYASRSAKELAQWDAADTKSKPTPASFLQRRSEQILKKIGERYPAFSSLTSTRDPFVLLGVALPTLALLGGAFLDRISDPHRVDLLSFPLLIIVFWNLLIYGALLAGSFLPSQWARRFDAGFLGRLVTLRTFRTHKLPHSLTAAFAAFVSEWAVICAPLTNSRVKRIVHLSSACFAAGAVLSLYARGLVSKYKAGWESTFFSEDQVHWILSWLFWPATLIFNLPGFSIADVKALQLPNTGAGAQWVHLYAGTLFLLVILPRLVLAIAARWKERKLAENLPLDLGQPYFRKLTGDIDTAKPAVLRVIPYSYMIDEDRDRGLAKVAQMLLGDRARVMLRPSVPYGEELSFESSNDASGSDITHTIALFNLSATPERETHGAFLDRLLRSNPRGLSAMIDESGFLERLRLQAGHEKRMRERTAMWRQFCELHNVPFALVNLLDPQVHGAEIERGLTSLIRPT